MHGETRSGRPLMDLAALARRLGVDPRHVRRLVAERRIPFVKWGHLLRFDPDDIDAWLGDARVPPRDGYLPGTAPRERPG